MKSILTFTTLLALTMSGCVQDNQSANSRTQQVPTPSFEAEIIDSDVQIGYGLAIGHVDDDGRPDILLADKKEFVWYQNGTWQRHVMTANLTARDNVALAAKDIDGDGLVEVAVGAMWNPGETSDASQSGSVHYLIRPQDATSPWQAVPLYHEPTTHRMHWVRTGNEDHQLVVLPLHGLGNKGGEGAGVNIMAYSKPSDPETEWARQIIDDQMHMTHNFDVVESSSGSVLYVAGKEGVRTISYNGTWPAQASPIEGLSQGAGEVRVGDIGNNPMVATIEPMHGTHLVAYVGDEQKQRVVLDTTFAQGHALAVEDLLGLGRDQIIAGWRNPNAEEKVGIKLYVPDETGATWSSHVIDDNTMASEDLKVADLDGDGKPEIIAAGRATNNLIIYWNRSQ